MLQAAMAEMGQIDQDEMAVIIPDTNKEDLLIFGNYLYNNHNINQENINFSSLLELINFESKTAVNPANPSEHSRSAFDSKIGDDYYLEDEDEEYDTSSPSPQFSVKDIRNLICNQPRRIKYEEAAGTGKHTKVWKSYKQILLDRKKIPFLECKVCGDIFLQNSTSSSTAIKKHAKAHTKTDDKQDQHHQIILNLGLEDVQHIIQSEPERITHHQNSSSSSEIWKHFSLISVDGVQVPYVSCHTCALLFQHSNSSGTNALKKHQFKHADKKGKGKIKAIFDNFENLSLDVKLSPGKRKVREVVDTEEKKSWDQNSIENIKSELQAPSQRTKDSKSEAGPGVSKFAISQLIQADSDRITFEESTTHSPVWEKFLKITLDSVEVPFVCCKYCKKVGSVSVMMMMVMTGLIAGVHTRQNTGHLLSDQTPVHRGHRGGQTDQVRQSPQDSRPGARQH